MIYIIKLLSHLRPDSLLVGQSLGRRKIFSVDCSLNQYSNKY